MSAFDKDLFLTYLRNNTVKPFGHGKCAFHVRMALAAGELVPDSHPVYAKSWGPTLETLGFKKVATGSDYSPQERGDIAVIQATSAAVPGHIQGYDGKNWISDFVQTAFWPGPSYRNEKPEANIYRWSDAPS